MTIQEFDKYLAENEESKKKFIDLKDEKLPQAKSEEESLEILSGIASELGCDVAPSEFALKYILCEEIDDDDVEKISGGKGCWVVFTHPDDTESGDHCWSDYSCLGINKDSIAKKEAQEKKKPRDTYTLCNSLPLIY